MTTPLFTEKVDLDSWKALLFFVKNHRGVPPTASTASTAPRWIFRGLSNYEYDKLCLKSSFDRAVEDSAQCIKPDERMGYERLMLYDFKRRAHHYLGASATPRPGDFLEWFGLMRHWGVPSRLVDFSYSFFVATYFAINNATSDAAVFCVDLRWLVRLVDDIIEDGEYFQNPDVFWKYAMPHPKDSPGRRGLVIPVRPFRSNDRVHAQQGLFLCPADVTGTFDGNLRGMLIHMKKRGDEAREHITKLKIKRCLHRQILHELRAMNISAETLFPGLEGLAQSMRDLLSLSLRDLDKDLAADLISNLPPF